MGRKFKRSQKDADDKSGLTEALGTRLESETRELGTRLKALDGIVQHHARRREKVESLKSEVEKQENELAAQKSTLEAQQSATQGLLQDVEELRQTLDTTVKDLRTAQLRVETRVQALRSESDQRADEGIQSRARHKQFE